MHTSGAFFCHTRDVADDLVVSELVPTGGSWNGLLFANPAAGLSTSLTWGFSFDFEQIERDYGEVTPGLTVEWARLPEVAAWSSVAGLDLACAAFGDPVEASVYYFVHYRYDVVRLAILDQGGSRIRARATLAGDIDGLGIPELTVEAWLDFEGVIVHLPEKSAPVGLAANELAKFTSLEGLVGLDRGHNYVFAPAAQ